MFAHFMSDDLYAKCGDWSTGETLTPNNQEVTCPRCRLYDKILQGWQEYSSQPSNFGDDSHLTRMAEFDAWMASAFHLIDIQYATFKE